MTNEKAIKMLEYIKLVGNGESEYKNDAQAIALDMAIKALERASCIKEKCAYCPHCEHCDVDDETLAIKALEPSKDCISRAEAIKETKTLLRGNYDHEYIIETLKMLPSVTPEAEQKAILDKITAEIWEEAEWAYSDFDDYKEAVLEAEPDELPDDEFRFGLHRAVEIINKYKVESEEER